jgi:hypothetical protein
MNIGTHNKGTVHNIFSVAHFVHFIVVFNDSYPRREIDDLKREIAEIQADIDKIATPAEVSINMLTSFIPDFFLLF